MPDPNFIVSGLSSYVKQDEKVLLKNIMFGKGTRARISIQPGVKTSEALHPFEVAAAFGDASACGFDPTAVVTISERVISVAAIKQDLEICPKTLEGKYAEYLTKKHDISNIFGEGSPIGKLYELEGYVLLIGVGYDKNTSLHLADARADYPSKHNNIEHSAIMENGHRVWKKYETLFVDGEDFEEIGAAFENVCSVHKATLGNGVIRLMKQRDLVDFAVRWIEENRK